MEVLIAKYFRFADFELDGTRRLLTKCGEPVDLNSKTFDLLFALVENHGRVLSKNDLLDRVWRGQFVEEGNLKVQVSTLRKIFGEKKGEHRFIVTVPGRGYSFVAPLRSDDDVVMERHRISRVLVEEQISENDDPDQELPNIGSLRTERPQTSWIRRSRVFLALSIFGVAALAAGGYMIEQGRSAKNSAPFQQMSIRRLTNLGNVATATISPDGKLFAYAAQEREQQSLWVGHVDGGEPVKIRSAADVIYLSIKFTPDGSTIYYTTSENFAPGSLYRIPVFGGAPEKIRDNFKTLTFSPDGKQFAFLGTNERTKMPVLFTADVTSGNTRELTLPTSGIAVDWHSPTWAPDGLSIALAAKVGSDEVTVFGINVADGSISRLTSHSWKDIRSMTWLPGRNGLVAVATENETVYWQLWHVSCSDGSVRRLTTDLSFYGVVASSSDGALLSTEGKNQSNIWTAPVSDLSSAKQITFGSPGQDDGWAGIAWTADRRIVYTADTDTGTNIWIMESDGKNRKQIIPNGGLNYDPSLTADGRFLVFQSNRSGHWAIWRSDLDGNNMLQLSGDGEAGQPNVSPDGKWIVYENTADGAGELWRMSIDGSDRIKLSDQIVEWPAISSNGRFVACGLYLKDQVKLAILPINGGEPIKLFDVPRLFNLRFGAHWTPEGKALTYRDWANGIWKQDVDGGEPRRIDGLPEEKLTAYGWSPDGKQIAFGRLVIPRDVVMIEEQSK